jgi:hypothetical protein
MQSGVGKLEAVQEINYRNDFCSCGMPYVWGVRKHFRTVRVEQSPEIMRLYSTRYRREHLLWSTLSSFLQQKVACLCSWLQSVFVLSAFCDLCGTVKWWTFRNRELVSSFVLNLSRQILRLMKSLERAFRDNALSTTRKSEEGKVAYFGEAF